MQLQLPSQKLLYLMIYFDIFDVIGENIYGEVIVQSYLACGGEIVRGGGGATCLGVYVRG